MENEKMTKNEVLIMLDYKALEFAIEVRKMDHTDQKYLISDEYQNLKFVCYTIAYMKNKSVHDIWNEYIERGELIVNNIIY